MAISQKSILEERFSPEVGGLEERFSPETGGLKERFNSQPDISMRPYDLYRRKNINENLLM
jgi:hypothetical protein